VCCLTVYTTRDGGGVAYTLLLCSSPFPAPHTMPPTKPNHPTPPTRYSLHFQQCHLSHRFPISCTRAVLRRRTTRRCIVSDKPPQTLWKTVSLIYRYTFIIHTQTQQLCILIYYNMLYKSNRSLLNYYNNICLQSD